VNNFKAKRIKNVMGICALVLLSFCLISQTVLAANKFWVGPYDGSAASPSNWSNSSGGSSGGAVPSTGDVMNFDGGNVNRAVVDSNMNTGDFLMTSGYTGIVTINDGVTLTLSSSSESSIITVSSTGRQVSTTSIPATNLNMGGAFTFSVESSPAIINTIVIKQAGSLPADSNISNLQLWYEATSTCAAVKPLSGTTQFGSGSASFVNNFATTTGIMNVAAASKVCLYVTYNIPTAYSDSFVGHTIDPQIYNPSTDVISTSSTASPATTVYVPGHTIILKNNIEATSTDVISSVLSLHVNDPAQDPTVFYLKGGIVYKKMGTSDPIRLTNPNFVVQSLTFTDLSGDGSGRSIKIQMLVSNMDTGNSGTLLNISRSYSTSATVKANSGVSN